MSGERYFWIVGDALELLRSVERLQRRLVIANTMHSLACWEPAVDLYEQDEELRLFVALPGVNATQLDVFFDDGSIVIRGKRPLHPTLQRAAIYRLEIPYGNFERRIPLPPGRYSLEEQSLEEGCLALTLRRL
jgi:HSP20 family protein